MTTHHRGGQVGVIGMIIHAITAFPRMKPETLEDRGGLRRYYPSRASSSATAFHSAATPNSSTHRVT